MSDEVARVGIGIVANDRSAAGWSSVEKRADRSQKRIGNLGRKAFDESDRSTARSAKSIIGSLGRIEQSAARALGGRSMTAGLAGRFGAVAGGAAAMGEGMAGASAAGGALAGTVGAVTMAVGGTIAVLGAAAYAAFKFTDSWAQGAAQLARTAETIGISTKALTEFSAAAERVGVDKGAAVGAVGGLSQTLNDARYGRNTQALEVLRRLGISMKLNSDGTVDTEAMLPAIANAIQRQNSSGRRTVARALGISEAALPAFSQGGDALSADMKDADKTAVVIDDTVGSMAKKAARKGVLLGQTKDRMLDYAGRRAAEMLSGTAEDVLVDSAQAFGDVVHGDFRSASQRLGRAGDKIARAAEGISPLTSARRQTTPSGLRNGTLNLSQQDVIDLKKTVQTEWGKKDVGQLKGVVDTILNRQATGHWGKTVAQVVNSRTQFTDVNGPVAWRRGRHRVSQIPMSQVSHRVSDMVDQHLRARMAGAPSVVGDNLNYANPAYTDKKNLPWVLDLDGPRFGKPGDQHRHGTTPELQKYRPGEFKVKVEVDMKGAPKGTRTTVKTQDGGVSHAFQNN